MDFYLNLHLPGKANTHHLIQKGQHYERITHLPEVDDRYSFFVLGRIVSVLTEQCVDFVFLIDFIASSEK